MSRGRVFRVNHEEIDGVGSSHEGGLCQRPAVVLEGADVSDNSAMLQLKMLDSRPTVCL